jgi:hypothetical protein
MAESSDNRSLGDLFSELSRETSLLVRKEVELATAELTVKARRVAARAGMAAAGGALAHGGVLVLLAALVLGLVQAGVAAWLSALVVAVVTIGVGYLLVNRGVAALSATSLVPTKTIETLKEDARWTTRQGA